MHISLVLVILAIILVLIATHHIWLSIGAFLFHPHVGGFFLAAAAFVILALMLFPVRVQQVPQAAVQISAPPPVPVPFAVQSPAIPRVHDQIIIAQQNISHSDPKSKSKTAATSKSNPADEASDQSTTLLAERPIDDSNDVSENTNHSNSTADQKNSPALPAWTKDSKLIQNGDIYVVVRSGQYPDPNVRDSMLDAKLVAAANDVIDNSMFHHPGMAEQTHLEAPYLREHCIDRQFPIPDKVAADDEVFIRLKFDGQFRQEMLHRHHAYQASFRVYQLGGIGLASFAFLGVLYGFLKLAPQSSAAGGAVSSFNSDPATRQSIYVNVRSYVRRHPWRFVLGGAIGSGIGALIAALIAHSIH